TEERGGQLVGGLVELAERQLNADLEPVAKNLVAVLLRVAPHEGAQRLGEFGRLEGLHHRFHLRNARIDFSNDLVHVHAPVTLRWSCRRAALSYCPAS